MVLNLAAVKTGCVVQRFVLCLQFVADTVMVYVGVGECTYTNEPNLEVHEAKAKEAGRGGGDL